MTVQSDGGGSVVIHVLLYWFVLMQCERVKSEPTQEKQALLAFLSQLPHANRLQWNESDSPCNWVGVQCDPTQTYVSKLRLPGVGLVGPIPDNTLGNLTHLRVISIRSNALSGTLPSDFSNLRRLHSLYLQKNRFSGEFPPSLTHLTRLTRLDLSANNFSGEIPSSINNLTKLTGLFMANNKFSGSIPFINLTRLVDLNISNNNFNGSIPTTLKKYPQSAFTGNIDLCGGPLSECEPNISSPSHSTTTSSSSAAPPPPHKQSNKLSTGRIIAIAGGAAAFVVLVVIIFLIIYLMKTRREKEAGEGAGSAGEEGETGSSMSRDDSDGRGLKRNRLIFISDQSSINGVVCKFELDDLLKASAEMLGKGSYGASYKAELDEETTVAVKRLKDATVSEKDFEAQVEVLGSIRHENVVPLRAFYYAQNERLLIYDYMPAGSLSNLLHGNKVTGRPPPNWETRVKIALTTAKGLAHLHASGKIVHGNIKSSNILLHDTEDPEAAITDYGLNTFFSSSSTTPAAHDHHKKAAGGYRAPEVLETRKSTVKSDVYSFGVLLLELLTGKSPCQQTSMGEEGIDLPRWVQSVVREEWASEVFDMDLVRYEDVEEEMVQLLQIAMTCVATMPDQRPAMLEVVRLIEDAVGNGDPLISIIP